MPTNSKTYVRKFEAENGKIFNSFNSRIVLNVKNSRKILAVDEVDAKLLQLLNNLMQEICCAFDKQVLASLTSYKFNLQYNPDAKFVMPSLYETVEIIVQLGNDTVRGYKGTVGIGELGKTLTVTFFIANCDYAFIVNSMAKALNWVVASIENRGKAYKLTEAKNTPIFEASLLKGFSVSLTEKIVSTNNKAKKVVEQREMRPNVTNYIFKVGAGVKKFEQLTEEQKRIVNKVMPNVEEEIAFLRKLGVENKIDFVFQLRATLHRGGTAMRKVNDNCEIVINLFDKTEIGVGKHKRYIIKARSKAMIVQALRHECGHIYHFIKVDVNNTTSYRQKENFADSYAQDRGSKWEDAIWAQRADNILYRNFRYTKTNIDKVVNES